MITDISQLSPELLEQLKALIGATPQTGQRSPMPKPLTDLREPSNPADRLNRPNFFFQEPARGPQPYRDPHYPKLKFKLNDDGQLVETCVLNATSERALGAEWLDKPPVMTPQSREDRLRAEFEALSPEDRALVLETQRASRLERLQAQLAVLSERELTAIAGAAEPAKRGPGRPRKVVADGDGA